MAPSRSAPITRQASITTTVTLEPDHTDVLAARDAGWIQIHCATCQEVLDSILIAYRLCEDPRVRLPVIVNQDGFYLSFTREPVSIPDANVVAAFLPPFATGGAAFRGGQSLSQGVAVPGGTLYSYFRYLAHLALQASLGDRSAIRADSADSNDMLARRAPAPARENNRRYRGPTRVRENLQHAIDVAVR